MGNTFLVVIFPKDMNRLFNSPFTMQWQTKAVHPLWNMNAHHQAPPLRPSCVYSLQLLSSFFPRLSPVKEIMHRVGASTALFLILECSYSLSDDYKNNNALSTKNSWHSKWVNRKSAIASLFLSSSLSRCDNERIFGV